MLFEDLSTVEITTLSQVTALNLAGNLDANDLKLLDGFVVNVGPLLLLLSAQKEKQSNKK